MRRRGGAAGGQALDAGVNFAAGLDFEAARKFARLLSASRGTLLVRFAERPLFRQPSRSQELLLFQFAEDGGQTADKFAHLGARPCIRLQAADHPVRRRRLERSGRQDVFVEQQMRDRGWHDGP